MCVVSVCVENDEGKVDIEIMLEMRFEVVIGIEMYV